VGENAVDVDDLRRRLRSGLDEGDYTLLYVWVRFWAGGGCACRTNLDAFLHGMQALSDNDARVLDLVVDELQDV